MGEKPSRQNYPAQWLNEAASALGGIYLLIGALILCGLAAIASLWWGLK